MKVSDGCKEWSAFKKWTDLEYIGDNFGDRNLMIFNIDRRTGNQYVATGRRNTMKDFVNMTKHAEKDENFFVKNELLVNRNLLDDIVRPSFIQKVLRSRFTGLTITPTTTGRKPEVKDRERYYCVVKGKEEYRLVSPVYKQNIYSGVLEQLSPNESPLDFFDMTLNATQYPLFQEAKVLSVVLSAGQCLFIPTFYWVQSQTLTGDAHTVSVQFEYESHSELLNLLFQAIDQGILEN